MIERTWAEGLNPTYQKMGEEQTHIFVLAAMQDSGLVEKRALPEEIKTQFLVQVLEKRIEAMKLPVEFTDWAKMAMLGLVDRPGAVIELLIDCLNAYEGKTVNVEMLADLYPMGFYDEATMQRYGDEFIKRGKVKWGQIY